MVISAVGLGLVLESGIFYMYGVVRFGPTTLPEGVPLRIEADSEVTLSAADKSFLV